MEVQIIKKKKNITSIYRQKLRVAAYVRVSTKLELQLFSYESQLKYYENKISQNSNWTLVGLYADYGVTGTSRSKRKDFLKLLDDAYNGKIDYILTKSVSRFARNTFDAIEIVRELKKRKIGIYFEEEHLDTLKLESELLLTILCSVAQQESDNYSNHIHTGNIMRMKQGRVISSSKIYGYDVVKLDKTSTFKINEEEAKIVKEIFDMYIKGSSFPQIANVLNKRKVQNDFKHNLWNRQNIGNIIRNPAYTGRLVQGKKYVTIVNGERRYRLNKGERDLYVVENHHPRIIDDYVFEKAKELRSSRAKVKSLNKEALSIPVICGFCGSAMGCSNRQDYSWQYICYKRKSEIDWCENSGYIRMDLIQQGFLECIKRLSRYMYRKRIIENQNNLSVQIRRLKNKRDILLSSNVELLNKYMEKKINPYNYKLKKKELENDIELLSDELEQLEVRLENYKDSKTDLENLFFTIDNEIENFEIFDLEEFKKIVSFIIIGGYSEKGTKLPYVYRYVYSSKQCLRKDYKEKVLSNPLKDDDYIKLLDFRSDFTFRYFDEKKNNHRRKGNRIIFEIER